MGYPPPPTQLHFSFVLSSSFSPGRYYMRHNYHKFIILRRQTWLFFFFNSCCNQPSSVYIRKYVISVHMCICRLCLERFFFFRLLQSPKHSFFSFSSSSFFNTLNVSRESRLMGRNVSASESDLMRQTILAKRESHIIIRVSRESVS